MAIDGSFSVEFALRRFVARCPELANHPQIDPLARKVIFCTQFAASKRTQKILL